MTFDELLHDLDILDITYRRPTMHLEFTTKDGHHKGGVTSNNTDDLEKIATKAIEKHKDLDFTLTIS